MSEQDKRKTIYNRLYGTSERAHTPSRHVERHDVKQLRHRLFRIGISDTRLSDSDVLRIFGEAKAMQRKYKIAPETALCLVLRSVDRLKKAG